MMKKIDFKTVTKRSWIKLTLYTLLLLLFAIWVGSPWVFLVVMPFVFDAFVTKLINWRWWETHPSGLVRYIMKWVEDIVVVVAIVHLLNIFIFQQFKIPTSSLEKTCLVGDHLYVSKLSYGPRIPMTPIAMPLVHNTFPWGGKAFSEKIKWGYRRLKGFGSVEAGDIVVFNFPAGDTVATAMPNPDYYTLVQQHGREIVHHDPAFGEILYRPVDMRDHYVKRCVGLPGDSLEVRNNQLYINGRKATNPEHLQYNYFVQTDGTPIAASLLDEIGVALDDRLVVRGDEMAYQDLFAHLGLDSIAPVSYGLVYHFPLTDKMKERLQEAPGVRKIVLEPSPSADDFMTYPVTMNTGWTRDDYGPIYIPKKGATISLTLANLPLYERCIRNYEGHILAVEAGRILIDGVVRDSYTFEMDYYWMMGDNRHNSADSRAWGFVPEDHIVGKPLFVWLSLDKDKSLFDGKIRWRRFFTVPK